MIKVEESFIEEVVWEVVCIIVCLLFVKIVLYGKDVNWGCILCVVGYVFILFFGQFVNDVFDIVFERISVFFIFMDGLFELKLLINGEFEQVDEEWVSEILEMEDLEILVCLGIGKKSVVYWICDFSYDYVIINGDYCI